MPEAEKLRRLQVLNDRQQRFQAERNARRVGRREEVLLDTVVEPGRVSGRTRDFRIVHLDGGAAEIGRTVDVDITGSGPNSLSGRRRPPLTNNSVATVSADPILWRAQGGPGRRMQIEMTIKGLMIDPITNMPIVILRDGEGQRILPIWVGVFEANAIALQIENVQTPRPMTHDLLKNVIQDLSAQVERIVVTELKENTFYAVIHLRTDGQAGGRRRPAVGCHRARAAQRRPDLRRGGGDRQRPIGRIEQGIHGRGPPPEVAREPVRRGARQVQDVVSFRSPRGTHPHKLDLHRSGCLRSPLPAFLHPVEASR